ncbi:MAG: response regulator [Candidatus Methylomirabilales bacterium]
MARARGRERSRILVVEDDNPARELLVEVLGRWGYHVQSAQDGGQAWNLLDEEPRYDLVITDLNMPVLDGLELLQRIRERSLPVEVILLTNAPGHGVVTRAQELGAFAILAKPHDLEELLRTVQLALQR